MVLEATILILDNSEWMRNGDYIPTRYEAQTDAIHLLFNAKKQGNPENVVGLMAMSGEAPQVLVTPTQDHGKIIAGLHTVKLGGKSHLVNALQIAQLALKHRQNKNQQQRIVAFVASPIQEPQEELLKLAKMFKKNGIAVDLVNFGEDVENLATLEAFIHTVNNNDNSHILSVPPGSHILSDVLISSPIMGDAAGSGASGFEFGVDPDLDPELALALRMSLEEEQARQQGTTATAMNSAPTTTTTTSSSMNAVSAASPKDHDGDIKMSEDDEDLARAIALSMTQNAEDVNQSIHQKEKRKFDEDRHEK